jgi:hypothetical protein
MKTILYTGAFLMIGASIYGFIDYKKAENNQQFKTMYEEVMPVLEEATPMENITIDDNKTLEPKKEVVLKKIKSAVTNKKAIKKTSKKIKKRRVIKAEFFSRGGLDDRYVEELKELDKQ